MNGNVKEHKICKSPKPASETPIQAPEHPQTPYQPHSEPSKVARRNNARNPPVTKQGSDMKEKVGRKTTETKGQGNTEGPVSRRRRSLRPIK